ncbi:MAG TPA: DNA-processing protein DprA [Woeseiaceae bacterium]
MAESTELSSRAWFVLAKARLGAPTLRALLEQHGSAEAIVALTGRELRNCGLNEAAQHAIRHPDEAAIRRDLDWLLDDRNHLVHPQSGWWPELFDELADAPTILYLRGKPETLELPALSIVGSRNPTRGGVMNAYEFARHLGASGFSIVSGLAQGIDTAAHKGALDANAATVAVLGHGIDRVYPAANHELAHRIAAHGALISEYPLGTHPRKEHFPERNRLISGMSLGTLVVEAAKRSGSLITARLAAEQGREVFAIPGSIHNALSRGCHELIRQGAKLVENADDIVSELGPLVAHLMQNAERVLTPPADPAFAAPGHDAEYERLLSTLGHDPATVDELAAQSGLTIGQVSSMLLILELEGEIEALHSGQYARLGSSSRHERERTRRADVSF